jgi:hypothetical protein
VTEQHPIVPPPELVKKWFLLPLSTEEVLVVAAQWGADQELEACVQWAQGYADCGASLRVARRPESLNLKERALARLALLERLVVDMESAGLIPFHEKDDSIRQALEQLND